MSRLLTLNKSLEINENFAKEIEQAENGRYTYFYFNKEEVEKIAQIDNFENVKCKDIYPLVQALFPQYLICSGLFDCFLIFEIKNKKRVDPPKYYFNNLNSYTNNSSDKTLNNLAMEIKDLFEKNQIKYSKRWQDYFQKVEEKGV